MTSYFGIRYEFDRESIYKTLDQTLEAEGKGYICCVDGIVLTQAHRDKTYRDIINNSLFAISDSAWVPRFVRWIHGVVVLPYQGPQMFLDVIRMRRYRQYFLGADTELLTALRERLLPMDPAIGEMIFRELPFCGVEDFDYESIAADINKDAADIIWVALGAPKQEQFMSRLLPFLRRGVAIAVGAAFKYNSGLPRTRRAPEWMVRCHVEFLFRLAQEPRKQGRRLWGYLTTLPAILWSEWMRKHFPLKFVSGLTLPMQRFMELVRCGALGTAPDAELFRTDVPWNLMLGVASQHMLVGVTYQAVRLLPPELMPPREIFVRWSLLAEKIQKMNALMDKRSAEVEAHFRELGYKSCILKGQGLARLYAIPSSRMPGDVDIWVDGERSELIRLVQQRDPKAKPTYHHIDYNLISGIEVELHYKPTWMYSPLANRRLQRFFQREAKWDIAAEGTDFHVPPLRLNMVFVLVHIYRHFFTEGVGLRQMMDYFFVLRACHSDADRSDVMCELRRLGMKRFTAATMWVLELCFGLAREQMLCEPDVEEGRHLLLEIMQAGNFGKYDKRMNRPKGESEFHTFVRKTRRNLHFLSHYPGEVLWSVPWRMWNWVMRTANLY